MKVDADDLHSFIDVAEDQEVYGREDSEASISIYPFAKNNPMPRLPSKRSGRSSSAARPFS